MSNPNINTLEHLQKVSQKVEMLIRECEQLKKQNQALQQSQDALLSEKAKLVEKSELARQKVDAMITRLKSMEMN